MDMLHVFYDRIHFIVNIEQNTLSVAIYVMIYNICW